MDKIVENGLTESLVGVSVEFRDGKSNSDVKLDTGLKRLRAKVEEYCTNIRYDISSPALQCACLASCQLYYLNQPNYFSIRSSILLGRNRKGVEEMLMNKERMQETFIDFLKKGGTHNRDLVVDGVKYFLNIYTHRIKFFKNFLTKEEVNYVL